MACFWKETEWQRSESRCQEGHLMWQRKLAISIIALGLAGCAGRKPGDPLKPGYNVYSKEQDIQLGQQAAQQISRQVDVVNNSRLQQYIDRLGAKLARQPESGGYPYEFTLINDPSINAFALPGGPIFVHSGLIAAADNEAHVAGVLSHEIAHVALRHATSQASKANLLQFPAALAAAILGQGSAGAQLGQAGLGFGLNALMLRYSRAAEEEADALGTRIMSGAGYNPLEMARFFEKLEAEGGSRAPQFLSSHPNPGNRVEDVQAEIQTLPRRSYEQALATGEFREAKQLVAQLPKPDRPVDRARAAPSSGLSVEPGPISGFQTFNANKFAVSYPRGWRVYGDRNSESIIIAPAQGLVQNHFGGTSVGYGVTLGYYLPNRQSSSVEQATRELLSQLHSSNPGMQLQGGLRSVRVDGSAGSIADLISPSPLGGTERDVLLAVARPEGLFYMVFIAPSQGFDQVQNAFDQMVRSIRFRR
jgi:beta-barrel assembly-enhancing protease